MHLRRISSTLSAALMILSCLTGLAHAAGGVYIDQLSVTNNGRVLFTDDFDKGKLAGWVKIKDAVVTCDKPNQQPPCTLHLNKHTYCAATAWHKMSVDDPGLLEMTAWVYITPPDEQYDCRKGHASEVQFVLRQESVDSQVLGAVHLNPCAKDGASVAITCPGTSNGTRRAVVPLLQWTVVSVQLDRVNGIASVLVNGQIMASTRLDPRQFTSLREIGICTGFGDGSRRSD